MVECPDCGSDLEATRTFNPEVFGEDKNNPICNYVCRNEDCKGWYCYQCEIHHPFGTSCSVALIKLGRTHGDMVWGDERGYRLYRTLHRKASEK